MDPKNQHTYQEARNGQDDTNHSKKAFYNKHSALSFIFKKTEKIVTAMYMVTDFISESEPMRYELRTVSLSMLSKSHTLSSRGDGTEGSLFDEVASLFEKAITLIQLSTTIGLISGMNGSILKNELELVQSDLARIASSAQSLAAVVPGYANIILTPDMFTVDRQLPEVTDTRFSKGQFSTPQQVLYKNPRPSMPVQQDRVERQTTQPTEQRTQGKKNEIGIKIARRNDVVAIVRSKGRASIKDIAQIIKDMSEKTLQRELLALVKEGVLVKEGEKRWSTYKIAS